MTMIVALLAPPLALAVTVGVELSALSSEERLMQGAADAAALAAAKEQTVAQSQARDLQSSVERFAFSSLGTYSQRAKVAFTAERSQDGRIKVVGTAYRPSFFGDLVPKGGFRIAVEANAEAVGAAPICVIGTSDQGDKFNMADSAQLRAPGCLVHSNNDIDTSGVSRIDAGLIQAVGVVNGTGFAPKPNAGALSILDPFAKLPVAPPSTCKATGVLKIDSGSAPLPAGVHCSNISVEKGGQLTLAPGEHHFMGELKAKDDTRVSGDDVVLVFHGKSAKGEFVDRAVVDLKGRRSGPLAGFVIVTARDAESDFLIMSDQVDQLEGTVYLPNATLKVRAGGDVIEDSNWTVIVARDVEITGAPRLVINSGYAGSPVPVPRGVGPVGDTVVRLTQ
jgi:hypothetical protein